MVVCVTVVPSGRLVVVVVILSRIAVEVDAELISPKKLHEIQHSHARSRSHIPKQP